MAPDLEQIGARFATKTSRPLPVVRIDGPYGAPAEDVFKSEVAVLIGAGIGIINL